MNLTTYILCKNNLPNSFEILDFIKDDKFAVISKNENTRTVVSIELLKESLDENFIKKALQN